MWLFFYITVRVVHDLSSQTKRTETFIPDLCSDLRVRHVYSRRRSHLILSIVLQSDSQERLEGLHVFLEVAAQN